MSEAKISDTDSDQCKHETIVSIASELGLGCSDRGLGCSVIPPLKHMRTRKPGSSSISISYANILFSIQFMLVLPSLNILFIF